MYCLGLLKGLNVFSLLTLSLDFPISVFQEGFDNMEPFVPVSVPNYNEKEFESCYLYYLDRNWLQHPHSKFVYLCVWVRAVATGSAVCRENKVVI